MVRKNTGSAIYSPENISLFRKTNKIKTAVVLVENDNKNKIRFQLFHSDDPGKVFSTTIVEAQSKGVSSAVVGADWGIRFDVGSGWSEVFFLGKVSSYKEYTGRRNFEFTYKVQDIDFLIAGIVIKPDAVRVGDQIWKGQNLNVDRFRNGDPILEAKNGQNWDDANRLKIPAWCYYEYNPANGEQYGRIYNWYAVIDSRGLAPAGWHVPSDSEYLKLQVYLGGKEKAAIKLKNEQAWLNNNCPVSDETNSTDWSALPGGWCSSGDVFWGLLDNSYWWCTSKIYPQKDKRKSMSLFGCEGMRLLLSDINSGHYIRCIRD